jgi:hypothetical protein
VDVLSGFAGADEEGALVPRENEVDYLEAFEGMLHNGSFLAGIGMRLALTFCALSPLWLAGRFRRFGALPGHERAALLNRLLHHPVFIVSELTLLMKLCACMALFRSQSVRERSSYDSHEAEDNAYAESFSSGERPKHGLPVVGQTREEEVA